MSDFKKRYLISSEDFNKLQKLGEDNKQKQLSDFQTRFFQDKNLQINDDDLLWSKLEKRLVPILSSATGQQSITSNLISKAQSSSGDPQSSAIFNAKCHYKGNNILDQIKKLPNVNVNKNKLTVGDQEILGGAGAVLENLIRPQHKLMFDSEKLLQEIAKADVPDLVKLIVNREAKEILRDFNKKESGAKRKKKIPKNTSKNSSEALSESSLKTPQAKLITSTPNTSKTISRKSKKRDLQFRTASSMSESPIHKKTSENTLFKSLWDN